MGSLGRLLDFSGAESLPEVPNSLVALGGRFLDPDFPGSKIDLRVVGGFDSCDVRSGGVLLGRKKQVFLQPPVLLGGLGLLELS